MYGCLARLLAGVLYGALTLAGTALAVTLIVVGFNEHHDGRHLDALNRRPHRYPTTLYITGHEQHCGRASCTYTERGFYRPRGSSDDQDAIVRPDYGGRRYDSVAVIAAPQNPGEVTQPGATGHNDYVHAIGYWSAAAAILLVETLLFLRAALRRRRVLAGMNSRSSSAI